MPMSDEELAEWLGIAGTKQCAAILASITPAERAEHEEFAKLEKQIIAFDRGEGPLPPGVIACGRGRKRNA